MRSQRLILGAILYFALAFLSGLQAAEFHVSPTGSDSNPGTSGQPFKTIERARDAVRTLKSGSGLPSGGVDIYLHGGQYVLTSPISLTPQDSGAAGSTVRYVAATGETPVLTSAKPITGWTLYTGSNPALQPGAAGHVWSADIPAGWRFHSLYVDNKPQQVACMNKSKNWRDWPVPVAIGSVGAGGQQFTLPAGLLTNLPTNGDVEMNLMPVEYWNTLSVVRDIDTTNNTCRRHSLNPTTFWPNTFANGNYNLQNALKFLTQAGEWCVDSAAGKVYYWPADGSMTGKNVWAPSLCRLLDVKGNDDGSSLVHHIELRGLTFTCTDRLPEDQWPDDWVKRQAENPDAMVFLEGVSDFIIQGNTFTYSGTYSLALQYYAQRVQVIGNEMGYSGCGGVQIQGYGPGTTDINHDNLIHRNYIHHTGNSGYKHAAAVTLYQSGNNEVSLNWIDNVPYAGIQICGAGWNEYGTGKMQGGMDSYGNWDAMYKTRWSELPNGHDTVFTRDSFKPYLHSRNNKLKNNKLTNYMNGTGDGGGLYSWSTGLGNVWDGNLMKRDFILPSDGGCYAIYMDDNVDGATISNNASWNKATVACPNKGTNPWTNNTIGTSRPSGFDTLLLQLCSQAASEGGWPTYTPASATHAVIGKVTRRSDGSAVSGATVTFSTLSGGFTEFVFATTTDADGNYRQMVPNGTWYVGASATGYGAPADQTAIVSGSDVPGINLEMPVPAAGDTTTRGNWIGKYGSEGYAIVGNLPAGGNNPPVVKSGLGNTVFSVVSSNMWAFPSSSWPGGTDPYYQDATQGLQDPANPTGDHFYSQWYSYGNIVFSINLSQGQTKRVSVFCQDVQKGGINGRNQTLMLMDSTGTTVLDSRWLPASDAFHNGVWYSWNVTGPVQLWAGNNTGMDGNAVVSGVFFDPVLPTGTITASAGAGGFVSPSGATAVNSGQSQTYHIWANLGYSVADVKVDGTSVGAVSTYTFNNVTTNHTISATFTTSVTYTITASAGSGGSISPAGTVTIGQNQNQTFSINPNSGYSVSGVLVDGAPVGAVSTYTFSNVTANHTISATFSPTPTFTITATAGANGTITLSGAVQALQGANQSFTINPSSGYVIDTLKIDGCLVGAQSSYTFTNVQANHTIAVTFKQAPSVQAAFIGRDTTTRGTWIGTYGSDGYAIVGNLTAGGNNPPVVKSGLGNTVFSVVSSNMWAFPSSSWPGGTDPYYQDVTQGLQDPANPTGNRFYSQWYSYGNIVFSINLGQGQTKKVSVFCQDVARGDSIRNETLTIMDLTGTSALDTQALLPGTDFHNGVWHSWNVTGPVQLRFTNNMGMTTNAVVSGVFFDPVLATYTITASAGAEGNIAPSGVITLNHGGSRSFVITPSTGYVLKMLTVDGAAVVPVLNYSFANVSDNHTIAATFAKPAGVTNRTVLTDNTIVGRAVKAWGAVKTVTGTSSFTMSDGYTSPVTVATNGTALPPSLVVGSFAVVTGVVAGNRTIQAQAIL